MNLYLFSVFPAIFGLIGATQASVPIPDLIFYGKLYQKGSGQQIVNPATIEVTAKLNAGTAVVAQVAKLVAVGDQAFQEYYVLRIPREDGAQRTMPDTAIGGDVLHLFVNGEEVIETTTLVVTASSNPSDIRRLDLNSLTNPTIDDDNDGLPDDWEIAYFGNKNGQRGDTDANGDGVTNYVAFLLGLDPREQASGKLPKLEKEGGFFVYYFRKNKKATGYDYFVQRAPTLGQAPWQIANGTVSFVSSDGDSELYKMVMPVDSANKMFFRLMIFKD